MNLVQQEEKLNLFFFFFFFINWFSEQVALSLNTFVIIYIFLVIQIYVDLCFKL